MRLLFCTVTSSHSLALTVTAPSLLTVGRSAPSREPSMKHARTAFAPACQGGWLGSYMGISQNFFGFKIPRISSTKISWNMKIVKHFLRHTPHSDLSLTFPLTFQCYISLEAFFRIVGSWKEQPKISGIFSGEDFAFIPLSGKAPRLG